MTTRPRRGLLTILAVATLAGMTMSLSNAQVQITIGASKDNTLYEDAAGAVSNGAGQHIFVGRTSGGFIRRALVAFNVAASIPAGSTIINATLKLYMSQTSSGPDTVWVRRVLEDWGEGTSVAAGNEGGGAPSTTNDATWIHRFFDTATWSTMGGVTTASPSASLVVSDTTLYAWTSLDLATDVQGWLNNPATNFGWMLAGVEDMAHLTKRFDSRDVATPAARPKLVVTYNPPVGVKEERDIPREFVLEQNYPNPFNPVTSIKFQISSANHVALKVFNALGQEVATLVDEERPAGNYATTFDASRLTSGVYFYRLTAGSFVETKRLVLLR